ncbi:MAG: heat-inducible transcriptional repressor HrcA [Rhodospirillales bacterium]|nr:heat-inducible transcriptional repressor HrcA [Alphaproteobacteria bacterium]MCB9987210.1 heat-inducible transcriptional repressor HrcA [Rhodospirillales bacterium]USO07928.1 MAG: heat-inducible transcriptional repressor HrcA [Rhodospirillales bacterium]
MLAEMDARARAIFQLVVDSYLTTREPVGSRTISQLLNTSLSPASIRGVMAELEGMGLLYAPHTSAGRLPTETGLRLYVDALLEVRNLDDDARRHIDTLAARRNAGPDALMADAGRLVAGLTEAVSIVATPGRESAVRQIQFVGLDARRALAVIVFADGNVENRIIGLPDGVSPSALIAATNFLNARLSGHTLAAARRAILDDIAARRTELDALSAHVVEQGLAVIDRQTGRMFVRGTAELLNDVHAIGELDTIQKLIDLLDQQETMARVIEAAEGGQGVRIYIGSENRLFKNANIAMVVAPARDADQKVVGAVGVIGPTYINYGRIVPIVDATSQMIARLLG